MGLKSLNNLTSGLECWVLRLDRFVRKFRIDFGLIKCLTFSEDVINRHGDSTRIAWWWFFFGHLETVSHVGVAYLEFSGDS